MSRTDPSERRREHLGSPGRRSRSDLYSQAGQGSPDRSLSHCWWWLLTPAGPSSGRSWRGPSRQSSLSPTMSSAPTARSPGRRERSPALRERSPALRRSLGSPSSKRSRDWPSLRPMNRLAPERNRLAPERAVLGSSRSRYLVRMLPRKILPQIRCRVPEANGRSQARTSTVRRLGSLPGAESLSRRQPVAARSVPERRPPALASAAGEPRRSLPPARRQAPWPAHVSRRSSRSSRHEPAFGRAGRRSSTRPGPDQNWWRPGSPRDGDHPCWESLKRNERRGWWRQSSRARTASAARGVPRALAAAWGSSSRGSAPAESRGPAGTPPPRADSAPP